MTIYIRFLSYRLEIIVDFITENVRNPILFFPSAEGQGIYVSMYRYMDRVKRELKQIIYDG